MGQLLRRFRSCETGSALTEYALMIAVLALGLVAALGVFRNSVGDMTNRTSGTISRQSGHHYGSGNGGGSRGGTATPTQADPADPADGGDSTAVATTAGTPAAGRR